MRIWRVEPPSTDGEYDGGRREAWKSEIVAEFGKGGARVCMVDVSFDDTLNTQANDRVEVERDGNDTDDLGR